MPAHRQTECVHKIEGGKRSLRFLKKAVGELPLVSIITAVYNGNETIAETIRSVMSQNYPSMEYLIIDGGSTDGTVETLKKYDDVIDYWVSEPDKGIYDALNKGIDLARGEWLYFLGADDKLADENVLQRFFSEPPNSKMLYGDVFWGSTGKIYDGKFSKYKLCLGNICQQAIFYHRSLFLSLGKFNTRYPIVADHVFNMRAFASNDTKPRFIRSVVAMYTGEGKSSRFADNVFREEWGTLIKDLFGLWYFIYFKIGWFLKNRVFADIEHILWILRKVPMPLLTGDANMGICPLCRRKTLFVKPNEPIHDNYLCILCRSVSGRKESGQIKGTK